MKIVNLQQFRKMKPGTVFSKYEPVVFGDISCFAGADYIENEADYVFSPLTNDVFSDDTREFVDNCTAMQSGESRPLDLDGTMRECNYEHDKLFAIYEKEDIEQLINKLKKCIEEAY